MHKTNEQVGSVVATEPAGAQSAPLPAVSRKVGDAETDQASRSEDSVAGDTASCRPDPTRYGDWERNGRCIDF
jgi:hypothetical protein